MKRKQLQNAIEICPMKFEYMYITVHGFTFFFSCKQDWKCASINFYLSKLYWNWNELALSDKSSIQPNI